VIERGKKKKKGEKEGEEKREKKEKKVCIMNCRHLSCGTWLLQVSTCCPVRFDSG
jgi:hypothetical protein